ncbi:MAG: sugar ABC transporter substrate-binding protein [Planctomycetota bacterium]|jgi:ABC-type sugar transport system substrate-binding protein|nr:sugar ABC transporter substrate-binding protein [Planctomycetota bacterium]
MKKLFSALLVAAFAATMVIAAAGEKLTIAVSIRSMSSEYHMQYVAGAEAFLKTLPPGTAEVQVLPCESNDDKQINDIKALLASRGKNVILFVDPNNAPNITAIAEACEDAGVYWCSAWNTPEGITPFLYEYWVHHQSCDGVKQGYDIAVNLFNSFKTPGKGKILVMQGMLANTANTTRMEGLDQALKEYPGIEVLDSQAGDWDTKKALNIMETWLARYNDIDGVWCASDGMALGIVQALKAKGLEKKVGVTGVDGVMDAIEAVGTGDLVCTIANNGWMQGGYGVAYAYAAYTGKISPATMTPRERMFYTNGFLVNAETLPQYRKDFIESVPVYDYNNLDFPIARPMEVE